jgi:hypothetical protein
LNETTSVGIINRNELTGSKIKFFNVFTCSGNMPV